MVAVAGASPVTITVRTPKVRSSVIIAAESARGGSLRAIMPASLNAAAGPTATAKTRKPCLSSSSAVLEASGDSPVRPTTAEKAPFTTRSVMPLESVTVASDILVAGSNGMNWFSFGRSVTAMGETTAERIAPSTGSSPPSELASAAIAITCASSKPGIE